MSEFINTVDIVGDEVLLTSIIDRTISEIKDKNSTTIGSYAFYNCSSLTSIDFPAVTSIGTYAFYKCSKISSVYFPAVTTTNSYVFTFCSELTSVNLPLLTYVSFDAFQDCKALVSIDLPSVTGISVGSFSNCYKLASVDFPVLTSIEGRSFTACSSLNALILRNTDVVCSLSNTNAFTSTPIASGTGYIYVPSALLDSYKEATNWSTYADQFRALEDYTVDGTTTGELDTTKI